ncbi:hypothetical protein [Miltoncostaea marina]|uniref:hypothetical protein n=1 Tax=Miltoncostaea marina TaxID=2843215 RepID=UPI001C3C91C5|nr:hypothetical protein [Miltoncostaea marina]
MSAWLLALVTLAGLAAVAARRPLPAAALVAAQTLLVGAGALAAAPGSAHGTAAAAMLLLKGVAVSGITLAAVHRVREPRPHDDEPAMLARLGAALALVLVVVALVPEFGLDDRAAERTAAALVATGLALVLLRRATLFAVLAVLVAENGVAVAAVTAGGVLPLVVEAGIAFDLVALVAVAAIMQRRIVAAFGTSDSSALRGVRD